MKNDPAVRGHFLFMRSLFAQSLEEELHRAPVRAADGVVNVYIDAERISAMVLSCPFLGFAAQSVLTGVEGPVKEGDALSSVDGAFRPEVLLIHSVRYLRLGVVCQNYRVVVRIGSLDVLEGQLLRCGCGLGRGCWLRSIRS